MRAGWQTKTLGEVCQIKPPKIEARNKLSSDELVSFLPMEALGIDRKFVRANQEKPLSEVSGSYTYFAEGDVLLAKITPCFENGKLGIAEGLVNGIGFGSSEYIVFRPNQAIHNEWLYYYISREDFRNEGASRMSGAVGHKRVAKEFVESYPIPVPPLPEQHRIVTILDEAFEGIATAKANAEQNLQNARALFESHLQSVFEKRGEGWVETTIGESCILRSGTTLPKEIEKPLGEIPYLKVADMNISDNLNGITCSSRYVNKSDVNASYILPVGTTIFPKRGGSILTNKKRLTTRPICADLNIMGVTPKNGLLPEFLFNYFLQIDMRDINNGSSIPQINNYSIEPLYIAFPHSISEQQSIVNKLESLSEETQRIESIYKQKLTALDDLKKSLLHQAFAGEL
jgi:type I restriction enzyme S subunit